MDLKKAQRLTERLKGKVVEDIVPAVITLSAMKAGKFLCEDERRELCEMISQAINEEFERELVSFLRE